MKKRKKKEVKAVKRADNCFGAKKINRRRETKETRDIVEKNFLAYPDVAADVINVLLYQGKAVTTAENLLAGPTETIYQGIERLRNQYEDLCKYCMEDGKIIAMYLIANQSKADGKMLLRKAGYIGGVYREQYEGKIQEVFPVIEFVLYWGKARWESSRNFKELLQKRESLENTWKYIDDLKLYIYEMRHLPEQVRKLFKSDMRIIVDYLAEGSSYCSDRKIVHKAALIKMINVLSGDMDTEGVENWIREQGIKEEDEVKVCELFEQYERRGIARGIVRGKGEDILEFLKDHGEVSRELQDKIFAEKDLDVLKRWLKMAAKAESIDEFQKVM